MGRCARRDAVQAQLQSAGFHWKPAAHVAGAGFEGEMSQSDDLKDRLKFMGFDKDSSDRLRGLAPILTAELPKALDAFYAQVKATPETSRFFPDETRIAAARERQLAHWRGVSTGQFDERFVRGVTAVGEMHARVGLEHDGTSGATRC